jgi:hypothetical protein
MEHQDRTSDVTSGLDIVARHQDGHQGKCFCLVGDLFFFKIAERQQLRRRIFE